jgi:parvulin-like peptidyl-prolyl isomerase
MIGLVAIGALGAMGVFSSSTSDKKQTAADVPVTPATSASGRRADARQRPGSPGAPGAQDEETVGASHLLVAYQGARRAAPTVTRTKEEAQKRAQEALAKAKKGDDFSKLVADYSDEPNAAQRQGKLGKFTRRAMVKPFADAAFALKPGQVSEIVETPFGFHVIKRTE